MAKIEAIKENFLFSKIYAKGKKAASPRVAVYALKNYRTSATRLGITTGRKLGNAVVRSRSRRLIREAFRLIASERTFQHPYLFVIVARSAITEKACTMHHVKSDLESAFSRLSVFQEVESQ